MAEPYLDCPGAWRRGSLEPDPESALIVRVESGSYWTLALKTLLSEYSYLRFSPADALYLINRSLIRLLPPEVFFTTAYLRVNRTAGEVLLLNGGHPPMIYLPTGDPRDVMVPVGAWCVDKYPATICTTAVSGSRARRAPRRSCNVCAAHASSV